MFINDKRIRIIIGHYGSGKTEFSVNYAMKLKQASSSRVAIADLDIVNVYFRSREKQVMLEEQGIKVIASSIAGNALDLPAVAADIITPLEDKSYEYVIDVGGDSVGARVLGRFKNYIEDGDYDMFMVVNANREQTMDLEGIKRHKETIEATSRLKVTGFINNTHLIRETTLEDVLRGDKLLKEASKELGIPIRYVSAMSHIASQIPDEVSGEILALDLIMRDQWM
ncbi:ATP-binding protein [Acetoanaerobium noterae]|uniref:ATP-binding protein n=1 Tax=Acetoanaerobium noterae TaxID=745369 RepID=UPI0028AA8D8B|nr:ATP-binding protein [Acetoanaerobium noterae]